MQPPIFMGRSSLCIGPNMHLSQPGQGADPPRCHGVVVLRVVAYCTPTLRPCTACTASPMMLLRVCDVCVEARPEVWTFSASKACSQFLLGKKNLSTLRSVDLASAGESAVWPF